jgi:hypothetical protein
MNHKLRSLILVVTAITLAPLATTSVSASIPHLIKSSPLSAISAKQSSSNSTLCQAELRRRMGGNQTQVTLSDTAESIVSSTTTRMTGTGVQSRSDRSDSQHFNFSCVINSQSHQVSSLSYTFTGSTVFGSSGSSFGSDSNTTSPSPHPMPTPTPLHW